MKDSTMGKITDLVVASSERMAKIGQKLNNGSAKEEDSRDSAREVGYIQAIHDVLEIIVSEQQGAAK